MRARNWKPLLLLLPGLLSCRQPAPEPPPPLPTPSAHIYFEEEVPTVVKPRIEVLELVDSPPSEGVVTVIGRVINRGNGPSTEVSVKVSALDAGGALVESRYATVTGERIEVGGTAAFSATFNPNPQVDRYNVEVIAR